MSVLGAVRSINSYTGSISCAASFSGSKDVTITSVDPLKCVIHPLKGTGSSRVGFTVADTDDAQLTWDNVAVQAGTVFRFNGVGNSDSGSAHSIRYAFMIVEYR